MILLSLARSWPLFASAAGMRASPCVGLRLGALQGFGVYIFWSRVFRVSYGRIGLHPILSRYVGLQMVIYENIGVKQGFIGIWGCRGFRVLGLTA